MFLTFIAVTVVFSDEEESDSDIVKDSDDEAKQIPFHDELDDDYVINDDVSCTTLTK